MHSMEKIRPNKNCLAPSAPLRPIQMPTHNNKTKAEIHSIDQEVNECVCVCVKKHIKTFALLLLLLKLHIPEKISEKNIAVF